MIQRKCVKMCIRRGNLLRKLRVCPKNVTAGCENIKKKFGNGFENIKKKFGTGCENIKKEFGTGFENLNKKYGSHFENIFKLFCYRISLVEPLLEVGSCWKFVQAVKTFATFPTTSAREAWIIIEMWNWIRPGVNSQTCGNISDSRRLKRLLTGI